MTDTLFTVPPKLTLRQQTVYDATTTFSGIDAAHAGQILHQAKRCRYCTPAAPCDYAATDGRAVLEALKRKGLLKRDRHHIYRRTSNQPTAQTRDLPESF